MTFLLDVPATVGLARAQKRRGAGTADRFEAESVEFHEKLRAAYRGLAAQEPGRIVVVDGRAPREVVAERIWTAVEERLYPARRRSRRPPRHERGRQRHQDAARDLAAVRSRAGRANAARRLQERPHCPCLADRRPARHRQGHAGFRFARFVLAHPDPQAPEVQEAASLAIDADHPVARRIAAQAQGDLRVLERVVNEQTGKLYTNIRVDDVRRVVLFFSGTAGEGGWRIAIVDAVDDLAREGANALLKVLEEPPARTLLLLLSHSPGRELPTIRSRCRRLLLRPLSQGDVVRALDEASGRDASEPELAQAAAAADGSVSRALALLDGPALALRQRVLDAIGQLPNPDARALHALADALGGTDPQTLATFMDLVNGWLSRRLGGGEGEARALARVAETWDKVNRHAREVDAYNLERKPFVFSVFTELATIGRR